jgi:hypothetical protein
MTIDLNRLDRKTLMRHRPDLFVEIFIRGRETQMEDYAKKQASKERRQ